MVSGQLVGSGEWGVTSLIFYSLLERFCNKSFMNILAIEVYFTHRIPDNDAFLCVSQGY